ncbi:MAG: 3-oxoacyl-[acyl-carrier-protein] reductase [Proteobacteria bacterium]|nr:3-oxoacyl-[acyl-carrier-protein] reductase [Pseudomonadota bacterium]
MFSLSGKTALITGASGGIGAAVAKALHEAGATIAISGTRAQVLEELKASLGGERVHVTPCNLSNAEDVEKLVPAAEAAMGGLDILVNNAGITRDGLAMRMKDDDWQAVLDVNLTSSFRLARAAMKLMMKKRWGRIVSITSVVGVTGNAGQANYVASKAGLIGLSKTLAQELASRNVTVNCVAPGFIATAMTEVLNDKQKEAILGKIPAGRMGSSGDIAAAVLYLASEEAGYVTGQTLHVNGGMAMI